MKRILNTQEAAAYMGVGVDTFNRRYRPKLKNVPVTDSREHFDVKDMDVLLDRIKNKHFDPVHECQTNSKRPESQVSQSGTVHTISERPTSESPFMDLLESLKAGAS